MVGIQSWEVFKAEKSPPSEFSPFWVLAQLGLSLFCLWVPFGVKSILCWVPLWVQSIRGWVPFGAEFILCYVPFWVHSILSSVHSEFTIRVQSIQVWVHSVLSPFGQRSYSRFSRWIDVTQLGSTITLFTFWNCLGLLCFCRLLLSNWQ
jgi:hypothetical protein